MRILFLTYYFKPDLCAGSFRNSSLFEELQKQLGEDDYLHVITSIPNRYGSYKVESQHEEIGPNYKINRVEVPLHKSGMMEQARSYVLYYWGVLRLIRGEHYDLVYASSSRLFTAFLGKRCSVKNKAPLYLDIRDIFNESIRDTLKNKKFFQVPLLWVLNIIENYTFSNAKHINLISGGFRDYFKKYPKPTYSEYTNGIDDLFVEAGKNPSSESTAPYLIVYAGNIGACQGLEKIIPESAKKLGENYIFRIIGDGSTKKLLTDKLQELHVNNVEILNPIARKDLIEQYREASFFFFHLNNLEAYEKVMPSKMFEYGAFDKPIIAGVKGFARDFIHKNIKNVILFDPADVDGFVERIQGYIIKHERREDFIRNYSRDAINKEMAHSIISVGMGR